MTSQFSQYVIPVEQCLQDFDYNIQGTYCNVTSDSVTCWPPTAAGQLAKQPCPSIFGSLPDKYAYKKCDTDGHWATTTKWKGFGHSDYSECILHLPMIEEVFGVEKEKLKETLSNDTTLSEAKTLSVVFLVLLLSACVFITASLIVIHCLLPQKINQSANYKIWRHFLVAIFLESLIRSVLEIIYLSQHGHSISTKPAVCETLITGLEYLKTAGNIWFLLQTYLHQLTAQSKRLCTSSYTAYIVIGWGISTIPAAIWAVASSLSNDKSCWNGYQLQPIIWIMDGSQVLALALTVIFLVQAFNKISKHSEMLATNCCYRRLYLESVGSAFYILFMFTVTVVNALHYILSRQSSVHRELQIIGQALISVKGIVLSTLLLGFNTDIRNLVGKTVRRISRQELTTFSGRENGGP